MFHLCEIGPKTGPIAIEIGAPQIEDGLCPFHGPAHAGAFHAVLDQMATGPFGDSAADGIARRQIRVIPHPCPVVVEVGDDGLDGFAVGSLQRVLGQDLFESADDIADLAFEQPPQSLADPRFGLGAAFGVKDMRPFQYL